MINDAAGRSVGRIPKWPTGADCKSAGLRLHWFESNSYHHFFTRNIFFLNVSRPKWMVASRRNFQNERVVAHTQGHQIGVGKRSDWRHAAGWIKYFHARAGAPQVHGNVVGALHLFPPNRQFKNSSAFLKEQVMHGRGWSGN